MVSVDSPIVGPPSGSLATALDYAGTDNADYVRELYRLCVLVGIDPAVLFAQWSVETADGNSARWLANHNPAGLGIEADSDADPAKLTQVEAARVHVWAMYYISVSSALWEPSWTLPDAADEFRRRWFASMPIPST